MSRTRELKAEKLQAENKIENYRQIERKSYSDLKLFAKDRKKYYKLKVLKDVEEIEKDQKSKEQNPSIRMGNLVDVRLTDNDNFDKYFVRTDAPVPTGQMLILANFLFDYTLRDTDDNGVVTSQFSDRFEEAYNSLKEQNGGKLQSGIEKFLQRFPLEAEGYYKDKLNAVGKTIISLEEEQKSETIANDLMYSIGTKELVMWPHKVTKYPILFEIFGELFKAEIDQIRFDHENKKIYLDDYKCSSFVETFQWEILDSMYYVQATVYYWGATQWFADHKEYSEYEVVPEFTFIVADQNNATKPLIFVMDQNHLERAWYDFKVGSKRYKGLITILEELKFAETHNMWDMSVENYKNKGRVLVPNFESYE